MIGQVTLQEGLSHTTFPQGADTFFMIRKLTLTLLLASLLILICTACSGFSSTSGTSASDTPNTVHMTDFSFAQSSITIHKGEGVTLVDDTSAIHIVTNGTWNSNGDQKPLNEAGAPIAQLNFQGNDSQSIGPFNTAGTFHYYCTVHQGMNLTVIVQ